MTPPLLATKGLTKVFGKGDALVRAVDDVQLEVHAGEMVLIMGPSGSGKTTLLTMIGGLLRPTSGTVSINGREITALSDGELSKVRRRSLGFIFQSFNLWETLSAIENIELALNIAGVTGSSARRRADYLLAQRGLTHRRDLRSRDLSGGEKQRLSVARALANEPQLILGDEPTANLDSRHGHEVMLQLRDISRSQDRAVVVVSHDQRIREVADRVLWLEDGRLADMSKLVQDPVCGMSTDQGTAASTIFEGVRYYFCSSGCQRQFLESPAQYAGQLGAKESLTLTP